MVANKERLMNSKLMNSLNTTLSKPYLLKFNCRMSRFTVCFALDFVFNL